MKELCFQYIEEIQYDNIPTDFKSGDVKFDFDQNIIITEYSLCDFSLNDNLDFSIREILINFFKSDLDIF